MATFYELQRKVTDLKEEIERAKDAVKDLEKQQQDFLRDVRTSSAGTITHAVTELLGLVTHVCKMDTALLNHSKHPKFIKYVIAKINKKKATRYIIDHDGAKINDICFSIEEVFEEAENTLSTNMDEVMRKEQRTTDLALTRVGKIQHKIECAVVDVDKQIDVTGKAISGYEEEKREARYDKYRLEHEANSLDAEASEFEERRSSARKQAAAGSGLALFGAAITPFLPFVGVPILAASGGWAIGSGVATSELTDKINALRNEEYKLGLRINSLQSQINSLQGNVSGLERDKSGLNTLYTELEDLRSKANTLQGEARRQVGELTRVKNAISVAVLKLSELNAHIGQLGYSDTREEMSSVLDIIVCKLVEGTDKLNGNIEAEENLDSVKAKISQMKASAPTILAILDRDAQKRLPKS